SGGVRLRPLEFVQGILRSAWPPSSARGNSPARMSTSLRAVLVPDGVVERVERDLQVAAPVIFPCRKPPSRDVDLQGGQDQLRHWQGPVAVHAELHDTCLV